MTIERRDGPTPKGGDYSIAVYVRLATMEEADRQAADGIVISEYLADGTWLAETVAEASPATGAQTETPEETFARLGFEADDSTETVAVFVGKRGLAAAKKMTER